MIKNTHISLKPSSSLRNDAVNSIKYTLLLDYRLPGIDDINNLIPAIMKSSHECCQGLFQNEVHNFDNRTRIYFNFFGLPNSNNGKTSKKADSLSFLDEYSTAIDDKKIFTRESVGFPTMILDHCVLSCYHALLTDLLYGKTVTTYEIANGLKDKGMYTLYTNKQLTILPEKILINTGNSHISSIASDFGKSIQTHFKALPHLVSLFTDENSSHRYIVQFSWLLKQICDIDSRKWRIFSSPITDKNKEAVLKNFEALSSEISPKGEAARHFVCPPDKLYAYYIKERIFNFNLVYSLLRNIKRIEKETSYRLCQKEILSVLSSCQKLPNVFSRQYFLQYAFDKLLTQPISYLDFWHDHRLDMNGRILESPPQFTKFFQFTMWIEQFSHFCNYMAEYVIPIYEWCFTNMLMEVIEHNFPSEAHIKHLEKALKALGKYIGDNYKQIICPVKIPSHQEVLDITTPHNSGTMDLEYPADFLQQILNEFCSAQRELDLNLIPLTPNFFKVGGNHNIDRNKTHIRNFYINLLYP